MGRSGEVDDLMFMGEHRHAVDDKGRLFIPARFRDALGPRFVVTRGLDRCVFVYAPGVWEKMQGRLESLPFTQANARAFTRYFLSGAAEVEPDRQGRILLPQPLRDYAGLEKDSVVIGVGDRVEIWAESVWAGYVANTATQAEELAEHLEGMGHE